ncbi:MAG: C50 carotenoid epsilon cyclase [Dehalococcoidia bacterium]|nr:MAG: C50 carotenoid epsilon cyclase [Dehalococcoidia bacterium]
MVGTSLVLFALLLIGLVTFYANPALAQMKDGVKTECYKEIAKTMVHGTASGLGEVLKGVKGEKERIDLIRAFVSPVRFYPDNSGYFYVYDYNCVNIAHGTQKDLQGKNLYDYKDSKGKLLVRELSAAAKKGGGTVEFYWVKPGSKGEFKKMGYVEPIPGTNYFIGTGVYLP